VALGLLSVGLAAAPPILNPVITLPTYFPNEPAWTASVEPDNWVNWVSTSEKGDAILTGSFKFKKTGEFGVYCYDRDGKLKWKDPLTNVYDGVFWTSLSRDGQYGAAGGWFSGSPSYQGFVRAYEVSTGKMLLDERTDGRVNSVAMSADGAWLASCSGSAMSQHSELRLYRKWRLPIFVPGLTPPVITSWKTWYGKSDAFDAGAQAQGTLAMSRNGQWIVVGGGQGVVRLFENQSGKLVKSAEWTVPASENPFPDKMAVQFLDMSADGTWFAAALNNSRLYMFRRQTMVATGKPEWTYVVNHYGGHNVYGVRVSTDGSKVFACSNSSNTNYGGYVDMFENVADSTGTYGPKQLWSFKTLRSPNPGLSMDEEGKYITVADGYPLGTPGHFYLLNAKTGQQIWSYQTGDMNWPITISPNGSTIVAGSDDGKIYTWHRKVWIPKLP
jgi:WD40 repeat protein